MRPDFKTILTWNGDPALADPDLKREAYRRCFGTVYGRQVLADILIAGGCTNPAWQPGMSADDAMFNIGVHAFACAIAVNAGLDMASFGRALIEGELEAMMEPEEPQDVD